MNVNWKRILIINIHFRFTFLLSSGRTSKVLSLQCVIDKSLILYLSISKNNIGKYKLAN